MRGGRVWSKGSCVGTYTYVSRTAWAGLIGRRKPIYQEGAQGLAVGSVGGSRFCERVGEFGSYEGHEGTSVGTDEKG